MISAIAPVHISAYTATSALGEGKAALLQGAQSQKHRLQRLALGPEDQATWVGRVAGLEKPLPSRLADWDCRNHRLAWLGLQGDDFRSAVAQAQAHFGAARVGVVMGTSTSSITATEEAYTQLDDQGLFPAHLRNPRLHTLHSLGLFVQEILGLTGPCLTISTACSSGAKGFGVAERWLRLGLADAVVVGGVDTLCGNVIYGFQSLQLLSPQPCQPFDVARLGINLGEAAAFALVQRGPGALQLLGYGESSDAYHLSAPHPHGAGVERALDDALIRANISPHGIDFVHLHGTASVQNDAAEAALVARRFSPHTHASSTKGLLGHTLGTAGVLGAAYCCLALETGQMPGTANTESLDPLCGPQIRLRPATSEVQFAISHAFGFGGSNCVLVWGRGGAVPMPSPTPTPIPTTPSS